MEPYKLDLTIWQGSTFSKTWVFSKDGAAWPSGTITARAQIRDAGYDEKLADFVCSVVSTATENTVTITLPATISAGLPVGKATWDIELYRDSDGWVWKPFAGIIIVKAEATK